MTESHWKKFWGRWDILLHLNTNWKMTKKEWQQFKRELHGALLVEQKKAEEKMETIGHERAFKMRKVKVLDKEQFEAAGRRGLAKEIQEAIK